MNTTITLNVVESNGTIDEAATEASFLALYSAFKAERITSAVNAVFDRSDPGTSINIYHLAAMAIVDMKVSPKDYGTWESRVLSYIRTNSKGRHPRFKISKDGSARVTRAE